MPRPSHPASCVEARRRRVSCGASRVYVGRHFRLAVNEGLKQGQSVVAYAAQHTLAAR